MLALCAAVLTLTAPATRFRATAAAVPKAVATPTPLWSPVSPVRLPNSPSEYDLNVGSLVDSLRHDYPLMLESEPDLSLFTEHMEFCGGPFEVRADKSRDLPGRPGPAQGSPHPSPHLTG